MLTNQHRFVAGMIDCRERTDYKKQWMRGWWVRWHGWLWRGRLSHVVV